MRKIVGLIGVVIMTFVCPMGWAAMLYVDGSVRSSGDGTSWETAFKRIQEGIDAASDGDTVTVAPRSKGSYSENIHFKGKNIVVRSTGPTDPDIVNKTIIDGGLSGSVVTFAGSEVETCVLSGFKIRKGLAEQGAGICGGTFEIRTRATIENNVITPNVADYGGGIAHCDGVIRNNTISDNAAEHFGGGLADCNGRISNNKISRNQASTDGAVGAGLCDCDGIIENNLIIGNWAWFMGGGLYDCDGTIQNNIISGNSVRYWGGGLIFCDGIIQNCTIVGNSAASTGTGWGGGLVWCEGRIVNCIFWGNIHDQVSGIPTYQVSTSAMPSYSCIQDLHRWTAAGEENTGDDPLFVDPDGPDDDPDTYEDNDYRVLPGSPCVNAGKNEYSMSDTVDVDGTPRIINGKVDMGAYEYNSTPTVDTTPPYVWDRHPTPDATRVPISTNIALHVKDQGNGVDEMSIAMTVNGLEVIPTITGTPMDYMVSCDPPSDFPHSESVIVNVGAADLSSPANVMKQVMYTFKTIREPSPARTWYVDGSLSASGDGTSPETAFVKIQEGIDAAADGDTVIVAQATYVENIRFESRNITLRSTDPSDPTVVENTIIDGDQSGPVVTFSGSEEETCLISGFTIQNGRADTGGGICGGSFFRHARAMIKNNTIKDNAAGCGGGVAYSDGDIVCNTVVGNSATSDASGGGGLYGCKGIIRNNKISGNSASFIGGGLCECIGTIQSNVINNNRALEAPSCGGGLAFCEGVIENNIVHSNSAHDPGGGMYRCVGAIRGNLIVGNEGGSHGGGLSWCFGLMENNTICSNRGAQWGGGLEFCRGIIRNCIIWGNTAPWDPELNRSDLPTYSRVGDDPHFVDLDGPDDDPDTYEDNDYRQAADSSCIDSGKNEDWMNDAFDVDGNPRIWGGRVDMGAYEYGSFHFKIMHVVQAGGSHLTWKSRPGDTYTIWSCTDLCSEQWNEEASVTSEGESTTWNDNDTASTRKFYRIEID